MKRRLVSLALGTVMLASFGGAVSAAPTNPNAVIKSCHGQTVSMLASGGNPPGHSGANPGEWNKRIKAQCEQFAPPNE